MTLPSILLPGKAAGLTSYFSPIYLVLFLPVVLVVYSVLPQKGRRWWLLAASYAFFWLISGGLAVYLLASTAVMYYVGKRLTAIQQEQKAQVKLVERSERKALKLVYQKRQRKVVLVAILLHIGGLLVLKYSGFFAANVNAVLAALGAGVRMKVPHFLLPIGISFFSLQGVAYAVDVYRGVIPAETNFGRLALFMSFFPQLVEGPICRYSDTAEQLWNVGPITWKNLSSGFLRILYGLTKKLIVADRLNLMITAVFTNYGEYQGGVIAIAAVCYTIQLYMDFSGTMDAVMGTAEIFGVKMPENFQRPFFSKSISEFWKRWHITLGTWFKDYIFYPVTMSKRMKAMTSKYRKKLGNHYGPLVAGSIALFCVWFSNGLWHGAAWSYVFFGMYHFVLILGGNMITPLANQFFAKAHLDNNGFPYRLFQMVRTTILVIIGELFFRATSLGAGLAMFGKIVTDFHFDSIDYTLLGKLSIDGGDFLVVAVMLVLVWGISMLNERGYVVRELLAEQHVATRWAVMYAWVLFLIIFGAYGMGYTPLSPIYANF